MSLLHKNVFPMTLLSLIFVLIPFTEASDYLKLIKMNNYTLKVTKAGVFEFSKKDEIFFQGPYFTALPISSRIGAVTRIRQQTGNAVLGAEPKIEVSGNEMERIVRCSMFLHPEKNFGVPEGKTLADLFPDRNIVKYTIQGQFFHSGKVLLTMEVEFLTKLNWQNDKISLLNIIPEKVCTGYPYMISWRDSGRGVKKGIFQGITGKKLEGSAKEGRYLVGGEIQKMTLGTKFGTLFFRNLSGTAGVRGPGINVEQNSNFMLKCNMPVKELQKGSKRSWQYEMWLFSDPEQQKSHKTPEKSPKNVKSVEKQAGTVLPVKDSYFHRPQKANLLFFKSLPKQPWWDKRWTSRLPVLLSETVGMERTHAPISVICKFPPGSVPESTRVVTPWLEEIPSQVSVIDPDKHLIEAVFLHKIWRYEDSPVFIYFSKQKLPKNEIETDLRASVNSAYLIKNEYLEAKFRKKPMQFGAILDQIRPTGGLSDNQISHLGNMGSWNHLSGAQRIQLFENNGCRDSKLTENGPIRKKIKYSGQDFSIEYSIYSRNDTIFYTVTNGEGGKRIKITGIWNIAGDREDDSIFYLGKTGIKKVPLEEIVHQKRNFIGFKGNEEGWLALGDRKNEVIGFLFDKKTANYGARPHFQGMLTAAYLHMKENSKTTGGLVCNRGSYKQVRKSYIAWKNPLQIYLGKIQEQIDNKPVKPRCTQCCPLYGQTRCECCPGAYPRRSFPLLEVQGIYQ